MAKILFLMDDTTHINKTELLNKKYNTNGISDFLNKEFERQKAENNSLVEVIDADFLEVLHNNYEADCFYSERLPEGVIGSYADFAKDFDDFHDWQNQLVYDFARADTDVVFAGNFIFFRFSKEQKEKWFSNKYEEFSKIVATVTAENFHEFATINKLQETISSSDSIVSYVMDGMSDIHRFDDMIRMIDSNEWYVIENAIKLSFDEEK